MTAIAICGAAVKAGENVYVIVGVVCPIVTAVPGEFTCTTDAAWTYGHGSRLEGYSHNSNDLLQPKLATII